MDTIITRLSEIESAANSIINHTNVQKKEYEQLLHTQQQAFDLEVSNKTSATIQSIKAELKANLDTELQQLQDLHTRTIQAIQDEYSEYHEAYIAQIMKNITEV